MLAIAISISLGKKSKSMIVSSCSPISVIRRPFVDCQIEMQVESFIAANSFPDAENLHFCRAIGASIVIWDSSIAFNGFLAFWRSTVLPTCKSQMTIAYIDFDGDVFVFASTRVATRSSASETARTSITRPSREGDEARSSKERGTGSGKRRTL